MKPLERFSYDVGQAARVAWFFAHGQIAGRLAPPLLEPPVVTGALPTRERMIADLFGLLRRDRANIEAGHYRPPDLIGNSLPALGRSVRFFADLGAIDRRRRARIEADLAEAGNGDAAHYPDYYLRNFHYQTDGYLSEHSAALYDFQVEVLFNGGADVMRRQALVPIAEYLRGRRIRDQRLLDVACGTGRFLAMLKQNYPRLPVTGVDLSAPYLRHAERDLAAWSWVELVEGAAERLPFADESFDVVTCVYLFHELPAPGAPSGGGGDGARPQAGRTRGVRGLLPARRRAGVRWPAGAVPARLPRALFRRFRPRGSDRAVRASRAADDPCRACVHVQGRGAGQAGGAIPKDVRTARNRQRARDVRCNATDRIAKAGPCDPLIWRSHLRGDTFPGALPERGTSAVSQVGSVALPSEPASTAGPAWGR